MPQRMGWSLVAVKGDTMPWTTPRSAPDPAFPSSPSGQGATTPSRTWRAAIGTVPASRPAPGDGGFPDMQSPGSRSCAVSMARQLTTWSSDTGPAGGSASYGRPAPMAMTELPGAAAAPSVKGDDIPGSGSEDLLALHAECTGRTATNGRSLHRQGRAPDVLLSGQCRTVPAHARGVPCRMLPLGRQRGGEA